MFELEHLIQDAAKIPVKGEYLDAQKTASLLFHQSPTFTAKGENKSSNAMGWAIGLGVIAVLAYLWWQSQQGGGGSGGGIGGGGGGGGGGGVGGGTPNPSPGPIPININGSNPWTGQNGLSPFLNQAYNNPMGAAYGGYNNPTPFSFYGSAQTGYIITSAGLGQQLNPFNTAVFQPLNSSVGAPGTTGVTPQVYQSQIRQINKVLQNNLSSYQNQAAGLSNFQGLVGTFVTGNNPAKQGVARIVTPGLAGAQQLNIAQHFINR